jgi:hypothetical protein
VSQSAAAIRHTLQALSQPPQRLTEPKRSSIFASCSSTRKQRNGYMPLQAWL